MSDDAVQHYRELFASFEAGRAGDPAWLQTLRRDAFAHFAEVGFPGTRLEEWRYFNTSAIAKVPFGLPSEAAEVTHEQLEELSAPLFACSLLVFVDGAFRKDLSSPDHLLGDVRAESLRDVARSDPGALESLLGKQVDTKVHPFAALSTAFLDDGALIRVDRHQTIASPLHLVFLATNADAPQVTSPRVLIDAAEGSQVTVIQDHVSLGRGDRLTNAVTQIAVGENAAVDLVVLQREADTDFHVSGVHAELSRDSRLRCHTLTLGGHLVRNDLAATLLGEGAEATLNGLFLGTGDEVIDSHTLVDHAVPHCSSHELYKGVLGGKARGVFRGRVIVRPDAQKTDARQYNANLILDDGAEVDSRPQLEIHADDVKCSHGSTIGQLDPEALFYLRSRAIDERAARELLTRGFAFEITSSLPGEAIAETVGDLLLERLRRAGEGGAR